MFCPKCGAQLPDNAKFCTTCGARMDDGSFAQNVNSTFNNFTNAASSEFRNAYNEIRNDYNNVPNNGPLDTNRGLGMYILLTLVTCGIYSYYFIYKLAKDVNTACEGDGQNTGGLLQYILLSLVTCGIYSIFWEYKLGNRLAENAPKYGMTFQENGTTILMWSIFGALICGIGPFVAMNIMIKNTNRICDAYNRTHNFY